MLTNNKDVNVLILSKLDFFDLREALLVNKDTSKFNNDILWFNYSRRQEDFELMKTCLQRPWKDFTLLLFQYLDLAKRDYNKAIHGAALGGHRDLVDFFISKGADDWNWAMRGAAQGGNRHLVDFFISKGANYWNSAMCSAAEGGHRDLVDFFISKDAKNWNLAKYGATRGGHSDLVDFFKSKILEPRIV